MPKKKSIRCGVYKIEHLATGKVYIGGSIDIERRWQQHRHDLNFGIHYSRSLQFDWTQYGESAFQFAVLETSEKALLFNQEKHWIEKIYSTNKELLYNYVDYIEVTSPAKGNAYNLGKHLSPEHCAKISAGNKGKPKSPEHVRKSSEARIGMKHTEEHKAKILATLMANRESAREKQRDLWKDPEYRKMQIEARLGKKSSEETKKKISDFHKGRKRPPETVAKMCAAQSAMKEQTRKTMTEKWKDPEYRKMMLEARRKKRSAQQ